MRFNPLLLPRAASRGWVLTASLWLACTGGCADARPGPRADAGDRAALSAASKKGAGATGGSAPAVAPGTPLVTGKSIGVEALASQDVGSLPVNMVLSRDGKYAFTTDAGYRQSVWALRTEDGKGVSHVQYRRTLLDKTNGLYYGLAVGPDDALYAAQGNADSIAVLKLDAQGELSETRRIVTGPKDFPAGLAADGRGYLYAANHDPMRATGHAFGLPASVAVYRADEGKEVGRYTFAPEVAGTSNFPLAAAVLTDGSKLYVTGERDGVVYVFDTRQPQAPALSGTLPTGSHPIALLLDKGQGRLFVANAQSDTVSVVDTRSDRIVSTILLRPAAVKDVAGATPTGLALSGDEKRLYVSLGDMNAVAVVDVADAEVDGYLPAGWYPTAVAAAPGGQRLLVANAKGTAVRNPNPPPGKGKQSPLNIVEGNVTSVALPQTKEDLKRATDKVLEQNRLLPKYLAAENPLAGIGLAAGKIKHVIYVVKENRTYDQVLGDVKEGNGDPAYCIFGKDVTPNQHALAARFVLMDNFYDSGEVSGDGWTWSTQAQANEYTIRNVPYGYSQRGHNFDYEGSNNDYPTGGFPAKGPDGQPLSDSPAFKEGAKAIPDVAEAPGGHLWDAARKAKLAYRNYGFFVSNGSKKGKDIIIPDNYPSSTGLQPGGHDLGGTTDVDFRKFDLDYADSEAGLFYYNESKENQYLYATKAYGKHAAPSRFSEWNREFLQMLAADPSGNAVPNLMTIRLCNDHTQGMNPDKHSPRSMVADNDYAVGQLVEAVSKSALWKSTAIFIIEDDAQDGPDHVDAHRSTCYVVSPWIKKGSVDHSFQNTVSCIKTMELLLGLPPMCQYDAVASPMLNWDDAPRNDAPYAAVAPARKWIGELNSKTNVLQPLVSPETRPSQPEPPPPAQPQPAQTQPAATQPLKLEPAPSGNRSSAGSERDKKVAELMRLSGEMDFTHADRAPAELLNQIIWKSVKGPDARLPRTPRGPQGMSPRGSEKDEDGDE